jgi:hypothetical protein
MPVGCLGGGFRRELYIYTVRTVDHDRAVFCLPLARVAVDFHPSAPQRPFDLRVPARPFGSLVA